MMIASLATEGRIGLGRPNRIHVNWPRGGWA
jgi:hypothetical protein